MMYPRPPEPPPPPEPSKPPKADPRPSASPPAHRAAERILALLGTAAIYQDDVAAIIHEEEIAWRHSIGKELTPCSDTTRAAS